MHFDDIPVVTNSVTIKLNINNHDSNKSNIYYTFCATAWKHISILQIHMFFYTIYNKSELNVCNICASTFLRYQLSESTSLLPSSGFSAAVFVDLFHFCEFSDSSEDDRFCLLHFARLFLNHT